MNTYVKTLKKYVVFSGRATRTEFWTFFLVNLGIILALAFLRDALGSTMKDFLFGLRVVVTLGVLIPGLAVTSRRLHDAGYSGKAAFLYFIPLIGGLILLGMLISKDDKLNNKYGPNPRYTQDEEPDVEGLLDAKI